MYSDIKRIEVVTDQKRIYKFSLLVTNRVSNSDHFRGQNSLCIWQVASLLNCAHSALTALFHTYQCGEATCHIEREVCTGRYGKQAKRSK